MRTTRRHAVEWGRAPSFLSSALGRGEWLASRTVCLTLREGTLAPNEQETGCGPQSGLGASQKRKISCTYSSLTSGQDVWIKLLFSDFIQNGNTSGQILKQNVYFNILNFLYYFKHRPKSAVRAQFNHVHFT